MPRENISDRNGRAFEKLVVDAILNLNPNNNLTQRAQNDQKRDIERVRQLPCELSDRFIQASQKICTWLNDTYGDFCPCTIDRLPDSCAIEGDVTDIRITSQDDSNINISLKNNHRAIKHQRPSALIQQLGISRGNQKDVEYRDALKNIYTSFYTNAYELSSNAINFRDLVAIDPNFILDHLYTPVCTLVASYINKLMSNPDICLTYFQFLVGRTDYIKVILIDGSLEIINFSAIQFPTKCVVSHNGSYIYLDFNNGWRISMRLHTAASAMGMLGKTPSLKFDTQPIATLEPDILAI